MYSSELNINNIRESFVNSIIKALKIQFQRDGFVIPICVLLFKNGKHQFVQPPSREDFEDLTDLELMQTYIGSLRMICDIKKPIALAMISESLQYNSDNDGDDAMKDFERLIIENEGDLSKIPNAKDIAVINIETPLTTEIVTLDIDRHKKKLFNQKRTATATSLFGGVLNRMNYN